MKGITSLPKLHLAKSYKKKPINLHSMLSKGAIHIPGMGDFHPAKETAIKVIKQSKVKL